MKIRSTFLRRWTLFGVLAGALHACVEPLRLTLDFPTALLTVDGVLTDLPEPQVVRLRQSVPDGIVPWRGAVVEVLVDGTQVVAFREAKPGDYTAPADFRVQAGRTYQLRFRNPDGSGYQSGVETMPAGKPIDRIYDDFDPEAVKRLNAGAIPSFLPGHRVYLDSQDPAGTRDYYNWRWKSWEAIAVCLTCVNSLFRGAPDTECWYPQAGSPIQGEFDYDCDRRCWDIFLGKSLNLFSDSYANGGPIRGRLVAEIPFYTRSGALVEIEQQALTPGAFRYYNLLAEQSQKTGSLVDTPPASIFGNVVNAANPNDKLVGYFTASSVTRRRYWLARQNVPADAPPPLGFLGGRGKLLPPTFGSLPPPLAPCLPSDIRTPVQPEGWRN